MTVVLSPTERLYFKEFNSSYLEPVYRLNSDPRVMRYMSEVRDRHGASVDLRRYSDYSVKFPGYGYWPAFIKGQDQFVGWFMIKKMPGSEENEIGYRLLPEFWGQGLATEGTNAIIHYAFNYLNLSGVMAVVLAENKASCRVLEKAGLVFKNMGIYYSRLCAMYVMERPVNE